MLIPISFINLGAGDWNTSYTVGDAETFISLMLVSFVAKNI